MDEITHRFDLLVVFADFLVVFVQPLVETHIHTLAWLSLFGGFSASNHRLAVFGFVIHRQESKAPAMIRRERLGGLGEGRCRLAPRFTRAGQATNMARPNG